MAPVAISANLQTTFELNQQKKKKKKKKQQVIIFGVPKTAPFLFCFLLHFTLFSSQQWDIYLDCGCVSQISGCVTS